MYHAQQGDPDRAFADLAVVCRHGYDLSVLSADPLFRPLRVDARFPDAFARKPALR